MTWPSSRDPKSTLPCASPLPPPCPAEEAHSSRHKCRLQWHPPREGVRTALSAQPSRLGSRPGQHRKARCFQASVRHCQLLTWPRKPLSLHFKRHHGKELSGPGTPAVKSWICVEMIEGDCIYLCGDTLRTKLETAKVCGDLTTYKVLVIRIISHQHPGESLVLVQFTDKENEVQRNAPG